MDTKTKMTERDLLNACTILVVLKDGEELLPSEIRKKSGLSVNQTERHLKFLSEKLYVIPRTVPEKDSNRILAKYGISKRGVLFLEDTVLVYGSNQAINFTISGKELKEALNFPKNHKCGLKNDPRYGWKKTGAIGGETSYRFTPTSLGVAVTIKCACGKEKNVTDYDGW